MNSVFRRIAQKVQLSLTASYHAISRSKYPVINSQSLSLAPILRPTGPVQVLSRSMANQRHKKMIKLAKGYFGRANRCFTVAKHRVMKARQYMYRDRKVKKRDFRRLWITRMNAASRIYGLPYGNLIYGLLKANVKLNRKVLSDIAVNEPLSFRTVVEVAKTSFPNGLKRGRKLRMKMIPEAESQ